MQQTKRFSSVFSLAVSLQVCSRESSIVGRTEVGRCVGSETQEAGIAGPHPRSKPVWIVSAAWDAISSRFRGVRLVGIVQDMCAICGNHKRPSVYVFPSHLSGKEDI